MQRMQGVVYHVRRLAESDKSAAHAAAATVAKAVALAKLAHVNAAAQPPAKQKRPLEDSSAKALAAIVAGHEARAAQAAAETERML